MHATAVSVGRHGIAMPDCPPSIFSVLIAVCDPQMLQWIAGPDAAPTVV
ncbi:hypothetical protein [Rhodococcus sp. LB1]|nr:hypothetical protein [Rhodococcus sp. LB1]